MDGVNERMATQPVVILGIVDMASDRLLGTINVGSLDEAARRAEVGYWVLADARRAGVAKRALRLLSIWAFESGGVERLEVFVEPANDTSIKVATACGYRREGVLRRYRRLDSEIVDLAVLARIAGEE